MDIRDTKKNNGVVLSTIIVGNKNQTVAPVFYIDGYSENGYTEEAAAQSIYENYQKNIRETTRMNNNELIHKLSRFSNVKNNICYKIVNTQANKNYSVMLPTSLLQMILIQAFMCYLIKTEHSGYLYCFTITQTF